MPDDAYTSPASPWASVRRSEVAATIARLNSGTSIRSRPLWAAEQGEDPREPIMPKDDATFTMVSHRPITLRSSLHRRNTERRL